MAIRGLGTCLRAGSALGLLMIATATANAGGFAVREQSAYFQGMSFAGVAAGGSLSSMFWNPATMTQFAGVNSYTSVAWIIPSATNNPTAGTLVGLLPGTGNIGDQAAVPAGYFSYQLNPNLWLGMSVNSPFGLSVSFPNLWAGRDYAAGPSHLRTFNGTPTIAYRINDWISVGAGVQIQYANAALLRGPTAAGPTFLNASLSGTGWGYGFTAGATFMPTPMTTIGLGYRSAINQKIEGALVVTGLGINAAVDTTLRLPDTVTLGIRQRVNPQLALYGTVEWTNWSRIGTSVVNGAPIPTTIPLEYKNGWFFAAGAEYQWTDRLAVRTGVGYEISPVTDQVRTPLVPDNDRLWASVGASYVIGPNITADLAYTHIWVRDPTINITATSGNPSFDGIAYVGNVNAQVDIISVGLKVRWGAPAAPAKTALITK